MNSSADVNCEQSGGKFVRGKKRVVLHIGTEMTGTAAIQGFLHLNREILSQCGVFLPSTLGWKNHWLLPGIFCEANTLDDMFQQLNLPTTTEREVAKAGWIDAFSDELRRAEAHTAVISSEHLQSRLRNESELLALRNFLFRHFDEIEICLYIRSPLDAAISYYLMSIKAGATSAGLLAPSNEYFRSVVDHQATIQRWAAVFGIGNMNVRIFDAEYLVNGDIVDDFVAACRLPEIDYKRPDRYIESLSAAGIELLQRVNSNIPSVKEDGTANEMRAGLVEFFENHFAGGDGYIPADEIVEAYDQAFSSSLEWVRSNIFPARERLFSALGSDRGSGPALDGQTLDQVARAIAELWQSQYERMRAASE